MRLTRRNLLQSTAGTAGLVAAGSLAATGLARPAIADTTPLRIGWLAALTGASSSTGVAMDRGLVFAVNEINAAGGVNGRKLELITRDTQSDPTKAVNAAVELTHRSNVNLIFGPANSGEALAVTGLLARGNTPQLDPCWVDTLIDVAKYPMAFRTAPSNQQIGAAANHYVLDVMKIRDVAIISDTTGYGTASVQAYEPMLKQQGANVVYQASIEASQPDLTPDMLRMRNAGAKVIMPWSVNAGFLARILNTRGQMGWDVPVAGQTTLGSGQTKALLEKPEYWENVFQIGFRTTSYGADGRLPPRTEEFAKRLAAAKIEVGDTLLWWIAVGRDAAYLSADAMRHGGTTGAEITGYLNAVKNYPGVYGDYSFTPEQHNGYPEDGVVMSQANSYRDGTFRIAAGYV
jgi:branched-chain amino acid transport system substrate-binding protein